jgi:lipopolysaccharide export LptBFGC system permease protein LptF
VLLYRIAQGKERILVVGVAAVIFLGLIQFLISASAATAIDYVQAMVTVAAFLAAVDILLRMPAGGYPRVDKQTSRNT